MDDANTNGNGGTTTEAGAAALPPETPEERVASLTAERDAIKDRMLRIAADFENWKKRSRKEQTDAVAQAREALLREHYRGVQSFFVAPRIYVAHAARVTNLTPAEYRPQLLWRPETVAVVH